MNDTAKRRQKLFDDAEHYGAEIIKNGKLDCVSLEEVVGNNKEIGAVSGNTPESNLRKVTMDDDLVKTARNIGINLGDQKRKNVYLK